MSRPRVPTRRHVRAHHVVALLRHPRDVVAACRTGAARSTSQARPSSRDAAPSSATYARRSATKSRSSATGRPASSNWPPGSIVSCRVARGRARSCDRPRGRACRRARRTSGAARRCRAGPRTSAAAAGVRAITPISSCSVPTRHAHAGLPALAKYASSSSVRADRNDIIFVDEVHAVWATLGGDPGTSIELDRARPNTEIRGSVDAA